MKQFHLKYPKKKKYKNQQSNIRYQYKNKSFDVNAYKTNTNIIKILLWKKNHLSSFKYVDSCVLIAGLSLFIKAVELMDKKCKELNGWRSSYLTMKFSIEMLIAIKNKFKNSNTSVRWRFCNEFDIYNGLNLQRSKAPLKLKEILFGIWVICSKNATENKLIHLRDLIEGVAKSQLIYHIGSYKSRKGKKYYLPWEIVEDPLIQWRAKNNSSNIQRYINKWRNKNLATNDIRNYFKSNDSNTSVVKKKMLTKSSAPSIHLNDKSIKKRKINDYKKRNKILKKRHLYLKNLLTQSQAY